MIENRVEAWSESYGEACLSHALPIHEPITLGSTHLFHAYYEGPKMADHHTFSVR